MLEKKLEELKQKGNYAVCLFFGEDIGCDDSSVSMEERNITVYARPVGYLGEIRIMYKMKLNDFLQYDFNNKPKIISNPPERNEYKDDGFYMWGTESSIGLYKEKSSSIDE